MEAVLATIEAWRLPVAIIWAPVRVAWEGGGRVREREGGGRWEVNEEEKNVGNGGRLRTLVSPGGGWVGAHHVNDQLRYHTTVLLVRRVKNSVR